jgi:hypothetical protein
MLNEALRQALELQAMLASKKRVPGHFGGANRPQLGEETEDDWLIGAVGSQAPMGGRQKTMTSTGNKTKDR